MKSHDLNDHGASVQEKKPWITPSLEIIALESAEAGVLKSHSDGNGHTNRTKS